MFNSSSHLTAHVLRRWRWLAVALFWSCAVYGSEEDPLHIKLPIAPSDAVYSEHDIYHKAVIRLILEKTGRPFTITPISIPALPASRVARYLNSNLFNIVAIHTDAQKERELRPIRYPVYRGLSGWRLLLIRSDAQSRFANIRTLSQLESLVAGMGNDWPDTLTLQDAGFTVQTAPHRDNLLKMLDHGRIDFFPRGIYEVWSELPSAKASGLVMEQTLALRYPTAFYFYVSRANEELAQLLERGFEKAIADGSFQKLFFRTYGEPILKANLAARRILKVPNKHMPPQTPLSDKRLWFSPGELSDAKLRDGRAAQVQK
ncbi:substrate-binding periplasmic protein [Teredinibacter turnerae]|uniref:substrate-binding periplasmic protein n=1 Tax=Teredinibacter turnerae TaxID=2426 RepID=UPI001E61853E|nr:transporter substrate-binding domain-containing protein [Teredinibacter turnerae]